jgi:hypothetical protein
VTFNLKALEGLIKLCRKQGVTEIAYEGISLKFGELPPKATAKADSDEAAEGGGDVYVQGVGMVPAGMTTEEFMFMSSPQPSEG